MTDALMPVHAAALHRFVSELQVIAGLLAASPAADLPARCKALYDLIPTSPRASVLVVGHLLGETVARLYRMAGVSAIDLKCTLTPEEFRTELQRVHYYLHQSPSRHMPVFRQLLEQHYADSPLTAREIAAKMSMSVSHLARVLKRQTGHGFRWHLRTIRVEQAKDLLASNRLIIKEVSVRTGFSSTSEFDRQFRSAIGMTPSRYRVWLLEAQSRRFRVRDHRLRPVFPSATDRRLRRQCVSLRVEASDGRSDGRRLFDAPASGGDDGSAGTAICQPASVEPQSMSEREREKPRPPKISVEPRPGTDQIDTRCPR